MDCINSGHHHMVKFYYDCYLIVPWAMPRMLERVRRGFKCQSLSWPRPWLTSVVFEGRGQRNIPFFHDINMKVWHSHKLIKEEAEPLGQTLVNINTRECGLVEALNFYHWHMFECICHVHMHRLFLMQRSSASTWRLSIRDCSTCWVSSIELCL